MTRFHYLRPTTVDAALVTLQECGARAALLAGGTDLLVRLRSGRVRPAVVVDLKRIEALESGIRVVDGRDSGLGARGSRLGLSAVAGSATAEARHSGMLRIGARCTITDLIAHEQVRQTFPALVEAARVVGSVQIRNRATLAGNICNASPAADTAPPLLVYGAVVNTRGVAGERRVPLELFFTGPGKTVLGGDEMVTSIDLPLPAGPIGAAFMRLTRRRGVDLATLTVCCAVSRPGGMRVALGAVAPTPLLVTNPDAWLPPLGGRTSDSDSDSHGLPPEGGSHGGVPSSNAGANSSDWWLPPPGGRSSDALRDPEHLERVVARIAAQASPIADVRAGSEYRSAMLPIFIRRTIALAMKRLDEYELMDPDRIPIAFTVNRRSVELRVEPHHTLLAVLRGQVQLTGTKECCAEGECGACTVLVDGVAVNACLMLAVEADGSAVTTIEGLAEGGCLSPMQAAFLDHGAVQCGFCIPGMVMAATALVFANASPTTADVQEALAGNLCRCGGYGRIVAAVRAAAEAADAARRRASISPDPGR